MIEIWSALGIWFAQIWGALDVEMPGFTMTYAQFFVVGFVLDLFLDIFWAKDRFRAGAGKQIMDWSRRKGMEASRAWSGEAAKELQRSQYGSKYSGGSM